MDAATRTDLRADAAGLVLRVAATGDGRRRDGCGAVTTTSSRASIMFHPQLRVWVLPSFRGKSYLTKTGRSAAKTSEKRTTYNSRSAQAVGERAVSCYHVLWRSRNFSKKVFQKLFHEKIPEKRIKTRDAESLPLNLFAPRYTRSRSLKSAPRKLRAPAA